MRRMKLARASQHQSAAQGHSSVEAQKEMRKSKLFSMCTDRASCNRQLSSRLLNSVGLFYLYSFCASSICSLFFFFVIKDDSQIKVDSQIKMIAITTQLRKRVQGQALINYPEAAIMLAVQILNILQGKM